MKSSILNPLARIAALSLSLAVATPAAAQVSLSPVKVVTSFASRASARADTLEQQAAGLVSSKASWQEAARLYRTAAELRADDPRAALSYRTAAWLYSASGNRGLARRMLEKAAEQSAVTGDPSRAAHTYIDAAFAAAEDGRTDLVGSLLHRARMLSSAEAVTLDQQREILRRLPGEAAIASR